MGIDINIISVIKKTEEFCIGLEMGKQSPEIVLMSNSPEIEDQELGRVEFEKLLYDANSMMEDWQYKEYCKKLIKLIKSTYK